MSVEEIRNLRAALRIDEGSKWDSGYVEAEFWKNIEDILGEMGFVEDMWGGGARSWTSGDVTVSVSSEFYPFVGEQLVDRVLVRGPLGEKEIPYPVLEGPWTTKEYYEHLMAIANIVQREAAMALGGFEMGESIDLNVYAPLFNLLWRSVLHRSNMRDSSVVWAKKQIARVLRFPAFFDSLRDGGKPNSTKYQKQNAYDTYWELMRQDEKVVEVLTGKPRKFWQDMERRLDKHEMGESIELDEAKAKKVSLSFGDTVDQGALGKSGKGIRINSEIYDWVVKKYLSSGKGTVTSKSAALSDQKIVINKKKGSMGVNTITISPLGKYIRVHSNEGGGLHAKGKTSYFSFSGLRGESIELDEAMNVNKVGQWRIEWPLARQGNGVAKAHHPEHGSLIVTTYAQDGKVYYLDADGGSKGHRSLISLKQMAMPYIMRKLAEKFGVDTVNEDVELDEARKYYVLVGKSSKGDRWEVVFGDYDKENVSDEKDSEEENWKSLKIISLGTDKQSAINAAIKRLNEGVELDEASDPKLAALKLEWAKLGTKALRAFASSPAQKKILKKQRDVEKKIEAIQGEGKPYYPDSWFEDVDLHEGISQYEIKRGEVQGDGRYMLPDSGISKHGLKHSDLIGWFANKYNMAVGWYVFEASPRDKSEFGANAVRTYSEKTDSMGVAKFNLKNGTYAFLDSKAYEDGVIKYEKSSAYNRISVINSPKAFRAFGINSVHEDVELDEVKLTKEDLKKPWTLNATQWLILKGVHQPWIAEISPFQYSRMSDRQKAAYDKKRAAEWDASGRAKQEWAKAVYDAYRAKKFDLKGKDVHPDAKFAAVRGQIASEEAQKKALFDKAREENFIKDTSELKVGDRVFSIMSRNYVDILKVSKKSVQISTSRGGKMKQDPRTLQWLSHDDLRKKVLGEDVNFERKAGEGMASLNESIGSRDKKVINAFLDKKAMDGKKLSTDGKRLDGEWIGGRGIAHWASGKIKFNDLGSKAAQSIQRAVKKAAPKNWIAEDVSPVSSIVEMRDDLVGDELDESSYGEKASEIMRSFTIPKFAKARLVKAANRMSPLEFLRFLGSEKRRAKRGKASAGAFPHKPNPKIIAMITMLKNQYNDLYKKLDDQGFASDEKNDYMSDLHKKTKLGYFKEDVELDEAKVERAHYPKKFAVKGTGDLKGLEISGKAVKQIYQAVRYEITIKSLLTKEVLATGETLRDIIHHDTGFNFKTGGEGAPSGIERDIKALIKKTLDADSSRWEDVELDEEFLRWYGKRKPASKQTDSLIRQLVSKINSKNSLKKPTYDFSDSGPYAKNRRDFYNAITLPNNSMYLGEGSVSSVGIRVEDDGKISPNAQVHFFGVESGRAAQGIAKDLHQPVYYISSDTTGDLSIHYFVVVKTVSRWAQEDVELDEWVGEDSDVLGALSREGIDNIFLRSPSPRSPIGKMKQAPGGKKMVYVYPGGSGGPGKQPIARYWVDDEGEKLLSGEILKGKIAYDFSMPDMSKSTLKVAKKFTGKTAEEFARLIKARGTRVESKGGTRLMWKEDVDLYEGGGYIQSELSKLGQNATPFTVQIADESGHKTKNMTFDNDLAVAVDKFLRGRRLDLSYRQSELKRLDKDSDSYTIKISDYDGKSTRWLMLDKASWKHISNLKRYKKEDVDLYEGMSKSIIFKFGSLDDLWDAHDALRDAGMNISRAMGGVTLGVSGPISGWVHRKAKSLSFQNQSVANEAKRVIASKGIRIVKEFSEDVDLGRVDLICEMRDELIGCCR